MRLLREEWPGKYGTKMLSEELFAILQAKIPQNKGPITINLLGGAENFLTFKNEFGIELGGVDFSGTVYKKTNAQRAPARATPTISWSDPDDIIFGVLLSGTQLNAVAADPISGYPISGTYEYDPPSGTELAIGENQALNVVFTPTNSNSYKRARKTVHIDVLTDAGTFVVFNWDIVTPPPTWVNVPLTSTELNADARDAFTNVSVPGTYTYTPDFGDVIDVGTYPLAVSFDADDTVTYPANPYLGNATILGKAVAFVQSTSGASLTVTAGNLLIVAVATKHTNPGVTVTVSDSKGNTYSQAGSYNEQVDGGGYVKISLWKAVANGSGANTFTVTPSAGTVDVSFKAEYEGVLAFDAADNRSGFGGDPVESGTPAISADRQLVISFVAGDIGTATTTTGFNNRGSGYRDNVELRSTTTQLTAPNGGANAPVDGVGGPATTFWCGISASFTHKVS